MAAVSSRTFFFFAAILMMLFAMADSRPFFSGLVSVDLKGFEHGFSSKGSKGCEVINNALAEDLSEFPEEMNNIRFRSCDWEWNEEVWLIWNRKSVCLSFDEFFERWVVRYFSEIKSCYLRWKDEEELLVPPWIKSPWGLSPRGESPRGKSPWFCPPGNSPKACPPEHQCNDLNPWKGFNRDVSDRENA